MSIEERHAASPIFIVSGGVGTSGEQVVNTVLAQFPDTSVPVVSIANVRHPAQIETAVAQVAALGGTLVHTLVETPLRRRLIEEAAARGVTAIDLMGPLLERLSAVLGRAPLEQPGRYRQLHGSSFARVAAIEYTMAHDDGQNPQDWPAADVLLLGVSRTGKTPLSIYLSVLGWKVANLPIVPELPVPEEIFQLNPARVIGLTIELDRLLVFRRQRSGQLGGPLRSAYADPDKVEQELRFAYRLFQRGGFYVLNMTDKTVEACADEIIRRIS